jgi:hypothetical protein
MSSTRDIVLGATACATGTTEDKKKKKRTGRITKKRLHIFMDQTKLAFNGWEDVAEPRNFQNCEAFIDWCHISREFLLKCYKNHRKTHMANLHYCNWDVFKERCIEMYQHIYDTPFVDRNECPLSILRMVYAEVVLGKQVDWMTIHIQPKSNMKALLQSYFPKERKFPTTSLGKTMPSKTSENEMETWTASSSDDEKTGCTLAERRAIEATINGRMVHNTLIDMVNNDTTESLLPLPPNEGGDFRKEQDVESSRPAMGKALPNTEAHFDPFQRIAKLEEDLASTRALMEDFKAKVEQLQAELEAQKKIVATLSGNYL